MVRYTKQQRAEFLQQRQDGESIRSFPKELELVKLPSTNGSKPNLLVGEVLNQFQLFRTPPLSMSLLSR